MEENGWNGPEVVPDWSNRVPQDTRASRIGRLMPPHPHSLFWDQALQAGVTAAYRFGSHFW